MTQDQRVEDGEKGEWFKLGNHGRDQHYSSS